jgi:type I restriction enzyme R subunit
MPNFTEDILEQAVLECCAELGYRTAFGPDLASDGVNSERRDYSEVILTGRLWEALTRINRGLSRDAIAEAVRKLFITQNPDLLVNNQAFQKMVTDGIDVESRRADGSIKTDKVWLFDFKELENNDWLAVNQFTIVENHKKRRPDVVIFVNGLPLALFELKSASDAKATISRAFNQLQTYKREIPSVFTYNAFLVISDGFNARVGSLTANEERFMVWRTIDGSELAPESLPQLEVLIRGMFAKERLLDLIRHFILFQTDGPRLSKIIAAYHQYHAVNKAVAKTQLAVSNPGDRRIGVVWHTQGSGKSLSMVFYAAKIVLALHNPTLVVLTDRNDLDDQLFTAFSKSQSLLRQAPQQAVDKQHLKELLQVESGGIIFTTIQKFEPDADPILTERSNVVVIADEAHRSQYGFAAKVNADSGNINIKYGYAKYMRDALPNASFIGFTGTPVEAADVNTPAVFGDYIDIYDMTRAVRDGTTVKIYYESRIARIELPEADVLRLDSEFDEITEQEEFAARERLKSKWARLEAIVGAERRVRLIAADLVNHFEQRQKASFGKGMIVTMSRRIAVNLYEAIIKLRSDWHSDDPDKGKIKIVMTGSASDPEQWQKYCGNKLYREQLANRMKDEKDPLQLVIVRDMWLTGFDVPCLHTMYLDKPMRGHNLMQAIARVNRVFRDKPGGLVVDYIGLADSLKRALADYTETDRHTAGIDTAKAIAVMMEKYQIIQEMFHGRAYINFFAGSPKERLQALAAATEHILAVQDDGKNRFIKHTNELAEAFSLCSTSRVAQSISLEIGFYKAVKAGLVKLLTGGFGKTSDQTDAALNQLISKSIISEEVVDILEAVGLNKPDISILSDEFLEEVRGMQHKNLAVELLKRLLIDKVKTISHRNLAQSKVFSELLNNAIRKYQNRTIETTQVIMELIELAKRMNAANARSENIGLNDDELAFHDALGVNDAAVKIMGDETLKKIARELTRAIKNNMSIDWNLRANVQAQMRVIIRRLLKKYGYPPDKQEAAIKAVMEQAELLGEGENGF